MTIDTTPSFNKVHVKTLVYSLCSPDCQNFRPKHRFIHVIAIATTVLGVSKKPPGPNPCSQLFVHHTHHFELLEILR